MKRKWLSMFLICMMLFSIVPCAAFADGMQLVAKASTDSVTAGDTFTVSIDLEGNPGVSLVDFTVSYDSSAMKLVKAVRGDLVGDNEEGQFGYNEKNIDDNPAIFIVMNSEQDVVDNGTIFTLNFETIADASSADYNIEIEVRNVENSNRESLTSSCSARGCTVSVKGADPAPTTYKVDVENGAADKATAAEGETVTITANAAPEGQEFDKWTGDVTFANPNAKETTFTMPANNVTVTANYKDKDEEKPAVEKVTVSFDANGGSGTMAAETVEKGSPYTLPACGFTAPAEKEFKAWEVNGKEYKAADKITVTADTTVKAIWAAVQNPATPKYNVVVTNGTGDGSYEAGQIVTITADSKSGYTFKEWNVVNGNVTLKNKAAKTTTFEMPAEAVEVEATYTKNSSSGGSSGGGSSSSGSSGSSGSSSSSSGGAAVVTKPDTTIILTIDKLVSTVNGQEIISDVAPIIVDGRTYTPARFVAEQLGAKVDWNEETQLVTVTGKDGIVIELRIGSNVALVNGKPVQMDAAAFIQDSRTYTPARFVAEQLGAKVDWDDTTRQVTITKTK